MCSLIISLSYFWDEVSHWTWSSSISGCCLSSRLQGPPRVELYTCGKDLNGGPHAGTHSRLSLTNQSSSLRKVFFCFHSTYIESRKSNEWFCPWVLCHFKQFLSTSLPHKMNLSRWVLQNEMCYIHIHINLFLTSVWNMEYYRVDFICIYTTKLYLCKIVLKLY